MVTHQYTTMANVTMIVVMQWEWLGPNPNSAYTQLHIL